MKDASINFSWFGVPCNCHCGHCLLSSGARLSAASYTEAQGVVERFLRWRAADRSNEINIGFAVGYAQDFPHLFDYIEFCRRAGLPGADGFQAGGIRRRSGLQIRSFVKALRAAGVRRVGLSFHGLARSHDAFCCRPDDFDFLLEIAQAVADGGMNRFETIFMRRSAMHELPELIHRLDAVSGLGARYLSPFDYRGRGKLLEAERPLISDLDSLPESLLQFLNKQTIRSEAQWVQMIASEIAPQKQTRHYFIPIWEGNLEELSEAQPADYLARLLEMDTAFRNKLPPLANLAHTFGESPGEALYALRDLEWKWTDLYLAQHLAIDRKAVFDDLAACVLHK